MIRKISSIDSVGAVQFEDDTGKGTTTGTEQDCIAYGFVFRANKCFCFDRSVKKHIGKQQNKANVILDKTSFATGIGNVIKSGVNNIAIGFRNIIQNYAVNSIALGKNTFAENYGELTYSTSDTANRGKFSIYQYDGVTTNDTATELFIGGHQGARLRINENFETAHYIETKAVILDTANDKAAFRNRASLYKYTNNTLTEITDGNVFLSSDSPLNGVVLSFAAVADNPDYIEVKATGLAGTTLTYNLILQVTQVRV